MDTQEVSVTFKSLNNCLVNLPAPLVNPFLANNILIQQVAVELKFRMAGVKADSNCLVGWNGYFSQDSSCIEIDPVFAKTIGLRENRKITIKLSLSLPKIHSVELEPETSADWELTELYAQTIEDRFLNQIRCATLGQKLAVYPTSSSTNVIKFIVKSIKSETKELDKGILATDSELHIQPKVHRRETQRNSHGSQTSSKRRRSVSGRRSSQFDSVPSCILRSIALPHSLFAHVDVSKANYEVFADLSQDFINSQFNSIEYVQVSVVAGPGTPSKISGISHSTKPHDTVSPGNSRNNSNTLVEHGSNGTATQPEIDLKKVIARLVHDPHSPPRTVGVSPLLAIALGNEGRCGDLICLEAPPQKYSTDIHTCILHKIISSTLSVNELALKHDEDRKLKEVAARKELSAKFQEQLAVLKHSPLTNGMKLPILPELLPQGAILEMKGISGWALLGDTLPEFVLGGDVLKPESFVQTPAKHHLQKVVGQEKLIARVIRSMKRGSSSIVFGSSGCGKTVVVDEVIHRLATKDGFYTKLINCETISNETFISVKNSLEDAVREINWHAPAVLVLENLDALIPREAEHGDSGTSQQICEFLVNCLKHLLKHRQVSLLSTSKSKENINSIAFQTHLIEDEFSIRAPDKELRKQLISSFIGNYNLTVDRDEVLNDITVDTEGYLPSDLKVLADRTFHDYISSVEDIPATLTKGNFERALQGFTPSSLRGVKLQKSSVSWSDIGGLKDAKQVLLETLEWPTKYAPIFANCPLRLRSGILLYGYPGCGKTLLASAVAAQCGLNFISIKGPEILNKYIGASEQSIRELFERAQSAKPCILFFDEFDSIAPKRGHDSTGVTDRVVNQLLTQMDGAEGLDGVYVLAATSRPDLIDSALLRPGRLDKSILCDLPDFENRLDILQTVATKFQIAPECQLETFARQLEGYSGADLQAFVYNSYLRAVHDNLDQITKSATKESSGQDTKVQFFSMMKGVSVGADLTKKIDSIYKNFQQLDLDPKETKQQDPDHRNNPVVITSKHFQIGLEETKKSISNKELRNFEKIYSQFVDGKREGNLPNGEPSNDIGGRTTLM
ncbi:hypothetical protein OGAPHI_002228 [Ogataea philodendri]|uniref:Peroxisomal ATPase PEX1 n=1 Tax=Ogataea philodendri TaxID=1378263 RepID=A0A9P8PC10_9ASCO|nr:uncharacterized protein OGAPHI_002228 [Ogataea philodendri]KAH3668474.1 hypothetical protein OGAPHI_002228 [Ogataea philodendri]